MRGFRNSRSRRDLADGRLQLGLGEALGLRVPETFRQGLVAFAFGFEEGRQVLAGEEVLGAGEAVGVSCIDSVSGCDPV